jgi:hypothetical protein
VIGVGQGVTRGSEVTRARIWTLGGAKSGTHRSRSPPVQAAGRRGRSHRGVGRIRAAGQRGRARSRSVPGGMGGEEVRPTRPGPAQSVAKRRVQDGGRVGRVGLEGGPGDRMSKRVSRRAGAASTEQRGGQRVLIYERRGQAARGAPNHIGRRQTRGGSAPRRRFTNDCNSTM